MFENPL
jgi:hypothetical protein